MLEIFLVYLRIYADNHSSIFEELLQHRFTKKPIYSANIIRYSLLLRYTSLQSYKALLRDFPLPSLSLLQKISSGTIGDVKCANVLRIEGKNSEDVCLIFDEMYLQKSQEYFGGEMSGCDDEGELYKCIVCFMIVGLKESIPYVIKSSPETNIDANWLKAELLDSLKILFNCSFRPPNVSSFKKLLEHVKQNLYELYILHKSRKIYLCYDAVHLIKNVRNNLLRCKRFIFTPFEFSGFKDPINVPGGKIAWKTFLDVFERVANLHANFRKAPKLTSLHAGNCRQNVPNALAIFDETTIAAVKSCFLEKASAAAS